MGVCKNLAELQLVGKARLAIVVIVGGESREFVCLLVGLRNRRGRWAGVAKPELDSMTFNKCLPLAMLADYREQTSELEVEIWVALMALWW